MSKKNSSSLLKINSILGGKNKKYQEFEKKVGRGGNFGNEEVKRAIAAGYSMDDVNDYLKYTGITPKGDFAVGGFTEKTSRNWGTKDSGYVKSDTVKDPYYRFSGSAPVTPAVPKSAPAPTPPPAAPAVSAPPPISVNPELAIPTTTKDPTATQEMNVGDSIRIVGENMGIKAKRSSAQKAKLTSKGTGRLTIPRSSGYQPLNMGM